QHMLWEEARDRAARGVEDANPGNNEPIVDRIDLTKGFVPGNVMVVSGKAYKMRHYLGMSIDEIRQSAGIGILHPGQWLRRLKDMARRFLPAT
ncbi:MAG: hypothetical protein JO058_14550, partial [Alphaproteobacteria bacterium]|nr:hypothetical protein [Alphaproteobacteria bacterium]